MIMQFIEQPNSLILAVSPANQDIATSDALNIAKIVDPKRERTIGVLTKLDLMDSGTNARDVLLNKTLYLARGYIGVVNRSQKDINEGKDIQASWQYEKEYFAKHPSYCDMADKMGSEYLQKVLHQQLKIHIKLSLPAVRKELTQKLRNLRKELKEFDYLKENADKKNSVQFYIIKLMQRFIEELCTKIYGHSECTPMKQLSHGFLINYKLYTSIQADLNFPKLPDKEELLILISNLHGIRNIMSVPSLALEIACGHLLRQYLEPLDNFVENIVEILNSAVEEAVILLGDYIRLKGEILYKINEALEKAAEDTKDSLKKHVEAEIYFMNTYHEDFDCSKFASDEYKLSPVRIWDKHHNKSQSSKPTAFGQSDSDLTNTILEELKNNNDAQTNVKFLTDMVQDYLIIQQKQIGDATIKHIAYFLVKRVLDFVKSELIPSVLESQHFNDILEECAKDYIKRDSMLSVCSLLEEAITAVQMF